jgi:hypothetical protein
MAAVHDMCHELFKSLFTWLRISSSVDDADGPSERSVRGEKMGADSKRIVPRIPATRTRRSNGWDKKFGSMSGASEGEAERKSTVPRDCGFMSRQMAPRCDSEGKSGDVRKEGGVCWRVVR